MPRRGLWFEEEKHHLNKFFEALPKLESYYRRKSTTKLYLVPLFKTKSEFYSLPALYKAPQKIKQEKYQYLMFLKQSKESDYHSFYDNVSHE